MAAAARVPRELLVRNVAPLHRPAQDRRLLAPAQPIPRRRRGPRAEPARRDAHRRTPGRHRVRDRIPPHPRPRRLPKTPGRTAMTMLDDNCRRLLKACTPPRLTEADLDRALARFEGRRRPAPPHARVVAAAAAVLLIAVLLVWPSTPTPATPAQTSPDDIAQLIKDLGSPEKREKATARLIAIGPPALPPLERALYHEDPEIRVQS